MNTKALLAEMSERIIEFIEPRIGSGCSSLKNGIQIELYRCLDGMALVPVSPTEEMLAAVTALRMSILHKDISAEDKVTMDYKAMINSYRGQE